MIADLRTRKGLTVADMGPDSIWMNEFQWISGDESDFPLISARVLVYVREDIPYREIRYHTSTRDLEGVTLEINLRKSKWLLFGGYNHTKSNIDSF